MSNGRLVHFWEDAWTDETPLCDGLDGGPPEEQKGFRVAQLWDHSSGWKWGEFEYHLPASSLVKIASIALRQCVAVHDTFEWTRGANGCTVKSAYNLCRDWNNGDDWDGWSKIWKLRIQQRVKVFAWLFSHGRIMPNAERWQRHITPSATCGRCSGGEEDELHAVRDCSIAKEIWDVLIPVDMSAEFYCLGRREWLSWLLSGVHNAAWMERLPEKVFALC